MWSTKVAVVSDTMPARDGITYHCSTHTHTHIGSPWFKHIRHSYNMCETLIEPFVTKNLTESNTDFVKITMAQFISNIFFTLNWQNKSSHSTQMGNFHDISVNNRSFFLRTAFITSTSINCWPNWFLTVPPWDMGIYCKWHLGHQLGET